MPNPHDRVTLFLNTTNTTVAVVSLVFIVWLQLSNNVPQDNAQDVMCGPIPFETKVSLPGVDHPPRDPAAPR